MLHGLAPREEVGGGALVPPNQRLFVLAPFVPIVGWEKRVEGDPLENPPFHPNTRS
jgi:hypothetical protein